MTVTLEIFQEEGQILFAAFIKSVVAVIQLGVRIYILCIRVMINLTRLHWQIGLHAEIKKLKLCSESANSSRSELTNFWIFAFYTWIIKSTRTVRQRFRASRFLTVLNFKSLTFSLLVHEWWVSDRSTRFTLAISWKLVAGNWTVSGTSTWGYES